MSRINSGNESLLLELKLHTKTVRSMFIQWGIY